jgi:hypothetical protein
MSRNCLGAMTTRPAVRPIGFAQGVQMWLVDLGQGFSGRGRDAGWALTVEDTVNAEVAIALTLTSACRWAPA